jgi:hypothetical protein
MLKFPVRFMCFPRNVVQDLLSNGQVGRTPQLGVFLMQLFELSRLVRLQSTALLAPTLEG